MDSNGDISIFEKWREASKTYEEAQRSWDEASEKLRDVKEKLHDVKEEWAAKRRACWAAKAIWLGAEESLTQALEDYDGGIKERGYG